MRSSRIQFSSIQFTKTRWRTVDSVEIATTRAADSSVKQQKKENLLNNHGTASRDYPGIIPAPFAIARDYHRSIRLLTQSLVNTDGRVATSYPLAIELFSVGRMHPQAGNTTGKNSYIKIEIFPVLSENG